MKILVNQTEQSKKYLLTFNFTDLLFIGSRSYNNVENSNANHALIVLLNFCINKYNHFNTWACSIRNKNITYTILLCGLWRVRMLYYNRGVIAIVKLILAKASVCFTGRNCKALDIRYYEKKKT